MVVIVIDVIGLWLMFILCNIGEINVFCVIVNDVDGNFGDVIGLLQLVYDLSILVSQMLLLLFVVNVWVILNGLLISLEMNLLFLVIDGLNIMLLKMMFLVNFSVSQDVDVIKKVVSDFIIVYNVVNQLLCVQIKYDFVSKMVVFLQGDFIVVGLNNWLCSIVGGSILLSIILYWLFDIGLVFGFDGNLFMVGVKFDKVMVNIDDFKIFFMGVDNVEFSNSGFVIQICGMVDQVFSVDGSVFIWEKGLQIVIDNNNKCVDMFNEWLVLIEVWLCVQYLLLDIKMVQFSSLFNYLIQQFVVFNK